jgi:hypothetical protein
VPFDDFCASLWRHLRYYAHMVSSSNRSAITCVLVILSAASYALAQSAPAKTGTASISGKVTVKDKARPGVVVIAIASDAYGNTRQERYRATTDQLGNYRISKVPAGSYEVRLLTQSLVAETPHPRKFFMIAEGENVEDIDFVLVRGGVITGKLTDADGEPLIERYLTLESMYSDNTFNTFKSVRTDDRGIYRFFGLPPSKYRVSAGNDDNSLPGGSQPVYKRTFYPSVMDSAKATVIEVTEGSEANNIDITLPRPVTTFRVSGRIVDARTGKPLPNMRYGVQQTRGNETQGGQGGFSNAAGEFKLDNAQPGTYTIYIDPTNGDVQPEALTFVVDDHDVTDLLIQARKGGSVSGVVVFENSEKAGLPAETKFEVFASVQSRKNIIGGRPPVYAGADGSFKVTGLQSGRLNFMVIAYNKGRGSSNLQMVRMERDGAVVPGEIELKDGEEIAGIKLVIKEITGAIRGVIKFENGEIPQSELSLWITRLDGNTANSEDVSPYRELDSRGRFLFRPLAPGTYEVNVRGNAPGGPVSAKQQVTVTANAVSEVTLTLTLKPKP